MLKGSVSDGTLVASRADTHSILAELWRLPHRDAREKFAKALERLGPDAKHEPRPGYFDLALLPGVFWNAKVPTCLLDSSAWALFLQKIAAAGPRSRRGTSFEEAAKQQPRGRSSGRRNPEQTYAKKRPASSLIHADVEHRQGSKKRAVSHRDKHNDVLSDTGEVDADADPSFSQVKYTRKRAPGHDHRGRQKAPAWVGAHAYISAKQIERACPATLGEMILDLGILRDRRGDACPCLLQDGATCPGKLALKVRDDLPSYRCFGRGGCQSFVRLLESDSDVFPDGVSIKDQMLLLWHWCAMSHEPSPVHVAMTLGLWPRTVRARFDRFRAVVSQHTEKVNNERRLGGWDDDDDAPVEVEMDEVLVRARAEMVEDGSAMVRTVRYCGMSERGNSQSVLLFPLPDRVVEAGGGGPISCLELDQVLRRSDAPDDFRLLPKTLVHTDSAKAYFNLGWKEPKMSVAEDLAENGSEAPHLRLERLGLEEMDGIYLQSLPEDSPLRSLAQGPGSLAARSAATPRRRDPTWADKYRSQEWMHTAVVHKQKKGRKRQFVCFRKVITPSGKVCWVKGGTQQIDGHWQKLKNHVTRSSINTRQRGRLHEYVRSHQWRHWTVSACRFAEIGKVLASRRELQSVVNIRDTCKFLQKSAQRKLAAAGRRCAQANDAEDESPPLASAPEASASAGVPRPSRAAGVPSRSAASAPAPLPSRAPSSFAPRVAPPTAAPAPSTSPAEPDFRDLPFDRKVAVPRPTRSALRSRFQYIEEERRAKLRQEMAEDARTDSAHART